MDDRKPKVLNMALDLFVRYGFRRTTMGDIAKAVGISRPTLYLLYENKEDIFRATLEMYYGQVLAEAGRRIDKADTLAQKLEAVLLTWIIEPYVLVHQNPDARDLCEITFSFARDVREHLTDLFIDQLEEVVATSPEVDIAALEARGFSARTIAAVLAHSSSGLKIVAPTLEDLESHLGALILMAVDTAKRWK
jgi:AcrR family transcriptional regulator